MYQNTMEKYTPDMSRILVEFCCERLVSSTGGVNDKHICQVACSQRSRIEEP